MPDTTLPELDARRPGRPDDASHAALVVVWSADASRLGEVLLPPPGVRMAFGRGGGSAEDPLPRLLLVRQRTDQPAAQPLELHRISRVQLAIESAGETLTIENLGKPTCFVNGVATQRAEVRPGDLLQIGRQLSLLCVLRPRTFLTTPTSWSFGSADAHGFVGESPAAWRLRREIAFAGARAGHVLVLGPTGTGKELAARALHALSSRAVAQLVSRNAATIPEGLADAELFGNLRGYPHAGIPERPGLVGRAEGSTLFLDEIGEVPQAVQAHLLRWLAIGEYQRLGDANVRTSDVRVIAATNRPATQLKEDFAARFPLRITTPGLDERREDIPLLVRHLLREAVADDAQLRAQLGDDPKLDPAFLGALVRRSHPTHVRGLASCVWDALQRASTDVVGEHLEPAFEEAESATRPTAAHGEAARIQAVIDRHNGSIEKAWKELGLSSRFALRRLIRKYNLVVSRRG